MTNTQVSLEAHFATPTGFGYNKELAAHYLPIIKVYSDVFWSLQGTRSYCLSRARPSGCPPGPKIRGTKALNNVHV